MVVNMSPMPSPSSTRYNIQCTAWTFANMQTVWNIFNKHICHQLINETVISIMFLITHNISHQIPVPQSSTLSPRQKQLIRFSNRMWKKKLTQKQQRQQQQKKNLHIMYRFCCFSTSNFIISADRWTHSFTFHSLKWSLYMPLMSVVLAADLFRQHNIFFSSIRKTKSNKQNYSVNNGTWIGNVASNNNSNKNTHKKWTKIVQIWKRREQNKIIKCLFEKNSQWLNDAQIQWPIRLVMCKNCTPKNFSESNDF